MGKVIQINNTDSKKPVMTLELTPSELAALNGSLDDVHVFSTKKTNHRTTLSKRGKMDASMYILVPKDCRSNLSNQEGKLVRIDLIDKVLFGIELSKA